MDACVGDYRDRYADFVRYYSHYEVLMASQYLPRWVEGTASGASLTIQIPTAYAGPCIGLSVVPPGSVAVAKLVTFDFEIFDSESVGQDGGIGCKGPSTSNKRIQLHDGGSIDITNIAATPGVWKVRLWYDE